MEYERIHKAQNGVISPSKLRMRLIGPIHNRKNDGSKSNSARTSPSKQEDAEFVKSGLLVSDNVDHDEEVPASGFRVSTLIPGVSEQIISLPKEKVPKENGYMDRIRSQHLLKGENGNSCTAYPMRVMEDENLDYDSTSSFEFHRERSAYGQFTRSLSRPMSSKWNDAEKWIMNKQIAAQSNYSKKNASHNQANRMTTARTALESAGNTSRIMETKRVDYCQPTSQTASEKFSFVPSGTHSLPLQASDGTASVDQGTQSRDITELDYNTKGDAEDKQVIPSIRSVCMRDMGTEMTPVASQEPSRTATPVRASTPLRSPTSSMPSTPRRGAPASTPAENWNDDDVRNINQNVKKESNEQEIKEKTRREIVALGVQLGKMSIAAWASKDGPDKRTASSETADAMESERIEFEKRAAAWEEAERSKHAARYKREEIRIQAWESQQKARLEVELRRIEAQVEQMRAQAQSKMLKKIAMARQRSEEKRAAAEARKNRDAERTATQAEYIRQTGRMPPSHCFCCRWLS